MKKLPSHGLIIVVLIAVCAGLSSPWHPFEYSVGSIAGYTWNTILSLAQSIDYPFGQMSRQEVDYGGETGQDKMEGRQIGKVSDPLLTMTCTTSILHLCPEGYGKC